MEDNFAMGYAMGQDSGGRNGNGGFLGGDMGWWGIILLALLFGWGNGGFGGGYGGGNGAGYLAGIATRADINDGFALQNITSGIQGIQQGICDATYALNNAVMGGFNATQMGMMQGFNGVQAQLCSMSAQNQAYCCETQRLMERGFADTNYNLATQECQTRQAIVDAGRAAVDASNANTRAILDFLTQDKISALTAENQTLKFAASQQAQNAFITANQEAQTAELIRRLGRDCPVPAYWVQPPTPVQIPNYENCGCGR